MGRKLNPNTKHPERMGKVWGWYRRRLTKLISDLRRLENDKARLSLLLELQRQLRGAILQAEKRILSVKTKLAENKRVLRSARLQKSAARALKDEINRRHDELEGYQALLRGYRAIGDGIAHCYFQAHDLRTLAIRENPGFISGKAGAKLEIQTLSKIIENKRAAVLCDITNTLRYGDIAVVTGDAPMFLEMKSGRSRTDQDQSQLEKIRHVVEYLHTDKGRDIYGLPGEFRRVTLPFYFDNHVDRVNDLIVRTYKDPSQFLSEEVEKGLWYCAMLPNDQEVSTRFDAVLRPILDRCVLPDLALLNAAKPNWDSFYPYSLTLRDPNHVIDFMQGSLFLYVIADIEELRKLYASLGYTAKIDLGGLSPIRLVPSELRPGGFQGELQLGIRTFNMLPMEFLSLSSFARVTVQYIATAMQHPEIRTNLEAGGGLRFQ